MERRKCMILKVQAKETLYTIKENNYYEIISIIPYKTGSGYLVNILDEEKIIRGYCLSNFRGIVES